MALLHSLRTANHRPYADVYADSTARLAATGFVRGLGGSVVAFTADDLYKKVLQLNDATEWILTAITPTWVQVSGAGALANDSVTNALLANMAQSTIKGRAAGAGTGDPTDLTATQATAILNAVVGDSGAGGTKGLVPAPAAGDAAAGKFLKADATWEAPGGSADIAPLVIEDDDTVAQRNGTTNQNLNIYGSYSGGGANYTRIRIGWVGSVAQIFSESDATPTNMVFKVGSGNGLNLGTGSLIPTTDATMALGDSSHYFTEIYNNSYVVKSGGNLRYAGGARLLSPASGIFNIIDDSGNSGSGTIRFDNRTPGQITSDQNNYSVPVTAYFIRLSTDASRNITGLTFGGGGVGDGQVHLLVNVGSNPIVLKHQDTNSTAGNRFLNSTGADITLAAEQSAELIYDGTTQRWRVFKRG